MVYAGIDIGGTGIQVGIVDEKGTILCKGGIVTHLDIPFADQVKAMADCTLDTLQRSGYTLDDLKSVGVGVPGVIDPRTGNVAFCTNLHWFDVPFTKEFQRWIDKPLFIDNDATVAGLAESVAGVSAGTSSSVFLTLGTGVGGAIIINGKAWSGHHGVGSELGHMVMVMDGEPCNCGNRGCVEKYCSATAIIRMAREAVTQAPDSLIMTMAQGDKANINAKIVIDAAREKDPTAVKVFGDYIHYLSYAISMVIMSIDPEVIVLGGGVSKAGDFLLNALKAELPKLVMYKTLPYSRLEIARLGPDAGIIGAAMLGH